MLARTSQHLVQLFDTSESLVAAVSSFLIQGYEQGGNLLLIARPRHREAIFNEFMRRGCFANNTGAQRLVALDAEETLTRISVNRCADADLFDWTIGSVARRLASSGELGIYAEMVELLAEQQDFDQALQVEAMWNHLAERTPFSLLCGYSSAHFTPAAAKPILQKICSGHTGAKARDEDSLGQWLLSTSGGRHRVSANTVVRV